jgi:type IV pilus assembly protein PilA
MFALYLVAEQRNVASLMCRRQPIAVAQQVQETQMSVNKKGFTLIELLIVVVIIGILASIAIPKFANTKDKAYVAQMKSDLRNLATYEEQYAADNGGAYFGGTATMAAPLQGFTPSQNVTIVATDIPGPPPSWNATATHSQSAKTCTMTNGVITCA